MSKKNKKGRTLTLRLDSGQAEMLDAIQATVWYNTAAGVIKYIIAEWEIEKKTLEDTREELQEYKNKYYSLTEHTDNLKDDLKNLLGKIENK